MRVADEAASIDALLEKDVNSTIVAEPGYRSFFYSISVVIPAATCVGLLCSYLYYFRKKQKPVEATSNASAVSASLEASMMLSCGT